LNASNQLKQQNSQLIVIPQSFYVPFVYASTCSNQFRAQLVHSTQVEFWSIRKYCTTNKLGRCKLQILQESKA